LILPSEYLMGRDKIYPLVEEQYLNMCDLLIRVNLLCHILKFDVVKVTSGYRPGSYNKKAGGAALSGHMTCKAVDLSDPQQGKYGKLLLANTKLLEELGLWLEDPSYTKGWIHLDTKPRKNIVFIPYVKKDN
jgi:hypothetical protein